MHLRSGPGRGKGLFVGIFIRHSGSRRIVELCSINSFVYIDKDMLRTFMYTSHAAQGHSDHILS